MEDVLWWRFQDSDGGTGHIRQHCWNWNSFSFPNNVLIPYFFFVTTECSNKTVEYEVVISGFELALQIWVTSLTIYGASVLIVKQLRAECSVRKTKLVCIIKGPSHSCSSKKLNTPCAKSCKQRANTSAALAASLSIPDGEMRHITIAVRRLLTLLMEILSESTLEGFVASEQP